jgi:uracil phosphoribosyltransferase
MVTPTTAPDAPVSSAAHVAVSRHPLVQHQLTVLRNRATEACLFRATVRELTRLLLYEVLHDLRLEPVSVQTPLGPCPGRQVAERVGVMPILRAGLGMVDAILEVLPSACVWHLGLYRDHETLQPVTYYNKLPADLGLDLSLVVDPMLATGGSAKAAVSILKQGGARRIKFLGLIAAPEGVRALTEAHPDVAVHLAAVDSHLNEHCYIVPGLGDAGDRQFSTH